MMVPQLVLHVIKCPDDYVGSKHIEIPANGGAIGRNSGSACTLSDRDKFISGTHGILSVYGKTYYLSDVSTNGTLINGSKIVKNQPIALCEGDRIAMGRYELSVSLEKSLSSVDIAADIAPKRMSDDPLTCLDDPERDHSSPDGGCIEDLFIEIKEDGADVFDPVTHLDFLLDKEDSLIDEPVQPKKEAFRPEPSNRQVADDTESVFSHIDVPEMIPDDWMAQVAAQESSAEPEVVARQGGSKAAPADWEEVTSSVVPEHSEPVVSGTEVSEVVWEYELTDAFCEGLGIPMDYKKHVSPEFMRHLGTSLKLSLDSLSKQLKDVASFKSEADETNDILSLMLALNEQELLAPSELMEQVLDELETHQVHYGKAVKATVCEQTDSYDPIRFFGEFTGGKRFVSKRKLWSEYTHHFKQQSLDYLDSGGSALDRKIKTHYNKIMKETNA